MPLKAGTKAPVTNPYSGSMAEAMENAFREQWPYVMGDADLPAKDDQMKLMFIAIAKGVIDHLQQNCDAFNVTVTVNTGTTTLTGSGEVSSVETE